MIPANTAAAAPTRSEPRLVVNRFWAISTTYGSSLLREYGDTGVEASDDTGLRARRVRAGSDVRDEVSGEVARRDVRNRAWAGVVIAVSVSAPASDVEDAKADHRQNGVPRTSERPERNHEDVDD